MGNTMGNSQGTLKKGLQDVSQHLEITNGGPNGIRTRVTDVRGQCPRPLDDGTLLNESIVNNQ